MIQDPVKSYLSHRLQQENLTIQPVGGGCINDCYKVSTSQRSFFCKINSASKFPHLFEREAEGLQLLEMNGSIRTPSVIDYFTYNDNQVLLLEWIFPGENSTSFWKLLGEGLAQLHKTHNSSFGHEKDNYLGSIVQQNKCNIRWDAFFIENRLQPVIEKSIKLNLLTNAFQKKMENIYRRIPEVFNEEPPSLLHGDLWKGNVMTDISSNPILIDPAVYYGHRAVDLGMTVLFGGFHPQFYDAYHYHFPLPPNYEEQWRLANLYPLFIHLILFGKAYLPQIERTVHEFQ